MDSLDKRIEKIVKKYNSNYENSSYICGFCSTFDFTEFEKKWYNYWNKINTKKYSLMSEYLKYDKRYECNQFTIGFLRLLVLEDFKNYLKQKGKK